MDAIPELERGRECYAASAWSEAFESLSSADRSAPLGADDAEFLARAAYMLGRDDDYVGSLERAHRAHLDAGEVAGAARCTFAAFMRSVPPAGTLRNGPPRIALRAAARRLT